MPTTSTVHSCWLGSSTGTNVAFNATGGGTVTSTDTTSTLATTTGTALNMANTTIGASGLAFRSINAGTAASGSAADPYDALTDGLLLIRAMFGLTGIAVTNDAIGGGHVLHIVCDLSIASENAVFGQVGPKVGSFDAGFGVGLLARLVGDKKAKEIWFLCRQYGADEALAMGLVNKVVPLADLEAEGIAWADEILAMSPTAIRFLKSAFLVATDGLAGLQEFAGNTTGLYYTTDEAHEGSQAFLEKRPAEYRKYPRRP